MLYFLLIITLHAGIGDKDAIFLGGTRLYKSFDSCRDDAKTIMEWLNQQDVIVEYACKEVRTNRSNTNG